MSNYTMPPTFECGGRAPCMHIPPLRHHINGVRCNEVSLYTYNFDKRCKPMWQECHTWSILGLLDRSLSIQCHAVLCSDLFSFYTVDSCYRPA